MQNSAAFPPVIETPRLLIKPFAPGLVIMPKGMRERPLEPEDGFDREEYRRNPIIELAFDEIYAAGGRVIFWELLFSLHRIAAGSITKDNYDAAIAYLDRACADNAAGKALRMAVILKEEQSEQKENLAGLVNLSDFDTEEPLLEIMFGTRIRQADEYLDEAYRAFMRWAREQHGFSRFRLLDKNKGEPSVPPDTVSVYDPQNPDKEFRGHINFVPGDVSIQVYEKPERPAPYIRETAIDCGEGLTLRAEITLERDGFSSWSEEPFNFVGNCHWYEATGETEEEVFAELRESLEKHFRL